MSQLPFIDNHYLPPNTLLWQGRHEVLSEQRIYQVLQNIDLTQNNLENLQSGLIIIGFMSDEGIKRNLGRPGAFDAPNKIRSQLASLPYLGHNQIYDIGNIQCVNEDLEGAQIALGQLVSHCHELGHKTLILGGGHETAWGHYLGLKNTYPDLGIINFDAHFDLRESEQATSGTPFLQIAKDKEKLKQPFDYLCYGVQKTANTKELFNQAELLNVDYVCAKEIYTTALNWQQTYIEDFINQKDSIYVSICMDVFCASIAPGVSAPQVLGLMPWHIIPLLSFLLNSEKVISIDIVELSPPFDDADITARLASQLAAEVITNL